MALRYWGLTRGNRATQGSPLLDGRPHVVRHQGDHEGIVGFYCQRWASRRWYFVMTCSNAASRSTPMEFAIEARMKRISPISVATLPSPSLVFFGFSP